MAVEALTKLPDADLVAPLGSLLRVGRFTSKWRCQCGCRMLADSVLTSQHLRDWRDGARLCCPCCCAALRAQFFVEAPRLPAPANCRIKPARAMSRSAWSLRPKVRRAPAYPSRIG